MFRWVLDLEVLSAYARHFVATGNASYGGGAAITALPAIDQALDRLVSVSCTHCCASTPDLSTL